MKITIMGLGHVALANALALARAHEVVLTGPLPERIEAINRGVFGLQDPALADYCARYKLNLRATSDSAEALDGAGMVLICTPRSTDPRRAAANMAELDSQIASAARLASSAPIIVRSAVPIGYSVARQADFPGSRIVPVPEFCRAGHMLSDTLYPNVLIVGDRNDLGREVLALFENAALRCDIPSRQMGPTEAELTRHLSVQVQAVRMSYFNELDSYALHYGLDARQIIDGVCLDPRIGAHGNNPCLGFAHHGLRRSARSLQTYLDPERTPLLSALEQADQARLDMLVKQITDRDPDTVGLYTPEPEKPLSPTLAALRIRLEQAGIATQVNTGDVRDLEQFKAASSLIVAHRVAPALQDLGGKVFARDHYMLVEDLPRADQAAA